MMPQMTKVAIDCRFAHTPHGLGRYTRELVTALLRRQDGLQYELIIHSEARSWAEGLPDAPHIHVAHAPHYSVEEHQELPHVLRTAHADLLFSPHFNVPFFCSTPFVVTIHDLILHHYPNDATLLRRCGYRLLVSRAVRRARRVIAVSNFTAGEVRSTFGKRIAGKVSVVPEGVSDGFRRPDDEKVREVLSRYGLTLPYFLYVGNAKEHKNVQMLIDAFSDAALPGEQLALVTEGKEVSSLVWREGIRRAENVHDEDLAALYAGAKAFVTASLYEGFCLPVAEAAACGCPVIAANRGAIPEAAPDGAMLIEPTIEAFAEAFRNPPLNGQTPKTFRWEDAAEQTARVLLSALDRSPVPNP
ncbi:MAG: glycosyltransferase family 1 protein [Candidatus Peribacteraceae bacterium]|jgi:glycosyltransferase involved in cell wall biosynthesis